MRFYINEAKEFKFEMDDEEKEDVKTAIRAFEAGIEYASNLSDDEKESKLAKYIANKFLNYESKKIAEYSFFGFIYQLKEKLGLN